MMREMRSRSHSHAGKYSHVPASDVEAGPPSAPAPVPTGRRDAEETEAFVRGMKRALLLATLVAAGVLGTLMHLGFGPEMRPSDQAVVIPVAAVAGLCYAIFVLLPSWQVKMVMVYLVCALAAFLGGYAMHATVHGPAGSAPPAAPIGVECACACDCGGGGGGQKV